MKKIIVLNHKMNLYYNEINKYIKLTNNIDENLIIAPSNIYLLDFIKKSKHNISSQDICYNDMGNFTSKVSWRQLKSIGIKYSLIGHSEKKEDIEETNVKLHTCLKNKIIPILCFSIYENDMSSIDKLLSNIISINKIIFAYEPIQNINNPNVNIDSIVKNIDKIKKYIFEKYKITPIIIYGGGINTTNIKDIYNIDKLDGILIGSKSSSVKEVKKLIEKINEK